MIIDCGTCVVRGDACADCVVTVLLGPPVRAGVDGGMDEASSWYVDDAEVAALAVLAGSGLVPPLRLVPAPEPQHVMQPAPVVPEAGRMPGSGRSPEPGRPRRRRTA